MKNGFWTHFTPPESQSLIMEPQKLHPHELPGDWTHMEVAYRHTGVPALRVCDVGLTDRRAEGMRLAAGLGASGTLLISGPRS